MDDKSQDLRRRVPSENIDSTLVRPIEASFLRTLEAQYGDMAKAEHDVKAITQSGELEFQIDRLYQSLHTVNAFTEVADKYSSRVLEEVEKVLAERETVGKDCRNRRMGCTNVTEASNKSVIGFCKLFLGIKRMQQNNGWAPKSVGKAIYNFCTR